MTPRPYQQQAITAVIVSASFAPHPRGILVSPAGSGKTLVSAWIAQRLPSRKAWLWVAPTVETVEQGRKACKAVGLDGVTFACYAAQPDASAFDGVILDECHRAQCDTFKALMHTVRPEAFALGVTATPVRADGLDITEVIGPIWHTVSRADVMAAGGVVGASVFWIDGQGDIRADVERIVRANARPWWTEEHYNRETFRWAKKLGIEDCGWRNRKTADMARRAIDKGRSCLVLVATIRQGEQIVKLIGDGAVLAHSGMKDRAGVMADMKAGKRLCMVATSLADEGLDLPILSVLVMACGGRAEGRTVQRIGRICRPMEGKPAPVCVDFRDSHHFMLAAQARKRGGVYSKLGVDNSKI